MDTEQNLRILNRNFVTIKQIIERDAESMSALRERVEDLEGTLAKLDGAYIEISRYYGGGKSGKEITTITYDDSTNSFVFNFSDGSNITVAFEDAIGSYIYDVKNGLTQTGNEIKLGGALIEDTLINSINTNEAVLFQTQTDGTMNEFGTLMQHQFTNISKQAQVGFGNPGFGDSWAVLFADTAFNELVNFFIGDQSGMGGDPWQVNLGYNDLVTGAQAALNMRKGTPTADYQIQMRSSNGNTISNDVRVDIDEVQAEYDFEDANSIYVSRGRFENNEAEIQSTYEDKNTGDFYESRIEVIPNESGSLVPNIILRTSNPTDTNELILNPDSLYVRRLEPVSDPKQAYVLAYENDFVRESNKLIDDLLDGIKSSNTGVVQMVTGAADIVKDLQISPSVKPVDNGNDVSLRIQYTTQSVNMNGYNIGSNNEHITKFDGPNTGVTYTWNLPTAPFEGQEVIIKILSNDSLELVASGIGTFIDDQNTSTTPYLLDGSTGNNPAITLVWTGSGTNQWMIISERT